MALKTENITFDSTDPERLADVVGPRTGRGGKPHRTTVFRRGRPPEGPGLAFQKVDDPTPGKNRVHIDFATSDMEAEVKRLVELGATETGRGNFGEFEWVVLADPDGNAFCVAPGGLTPDARKLD